MNRIGLFFFAYIFFIFIFVYFLTPTSARAQIVPCNGGTCFPGGCPSGWNPLAYCDAAGTSWCCAKAPPPPPPPNCNQAGYISPNCTNGNNNCGGGTQSVYIDLYNGSTYCSNPYWTTWSCNIGNCNPLQSQCIGGHCTPFYSVTINVTDPDNGGGVGGVDIHARENNGPTHNGTTNNNGNYTFTYLIQQGNSVTGSISNKAGYQIIGPSSKTVNNVRANQTIRFSMAQLFSISGNVFSDTNKNRIKDSTNGVPEANISGIAMASSGGPSNGGSLSVNSTAGTYRVSNVRTGTYTVSYTSAYPTGYFLIYPLNGPPPFLRITVGPNCRTSNNLTYGLTCTNGDVSNANFAISNSMPWMQGYGFDMRIDEGFTDKIPSAPIYPAYASLSDLINGH